MLRRIYQKLPIIRELRQISRQLNAHDNSQIQQINQQIRTQQISQQIQIQQLDYMERLLSIPRYAAEKNLNRYEFQVFSQSGEDGIIAEIFR